MSKVTILCGVCERPAWLSMGTMFVHNLRRSHPIAVHDLRDGQVICSRCVAAFIAQGPEAGSPAAIAEANREARIL